MSSLNCVFSKPPIAHYATTKSSGVSGSSALLLCLLVVTALSSSQTGERGRGVEVAKGIEFSLPASWQLANRTSNGVEIIYPLQKERAARPRGKEKPESGEQLVSAEARIAVSWEQRRSHAEAVVRL